MANVGGSGAPVRLRVKGVGDEGGGVAADAGVPGSAVVEVFGPCVVAAELQAVGEAAAQIEREAVVEAGAL